MEHCDIVIREETRSDLEKIFQTYGSNSNLFYYERNFYSCGSNEKRYPHQHLQYVFLAEENECIVGYVHFSFDYDDFFDGDDGVRILSLKADPSIPIEKARIVRHKLRREIYRQFPTEPDFR